MPIWFELIALLLAFYGGGVGMGWLLWSREIGRRIEDHEREDE